MARLGRKPLKIPTTRWEVRIRADLAAEVELLLADPLKNKPIYGARSELLEQLLANYVRERKSGTYVEIPLTVEQVALLMKSNPADVTLNLSTGTARMPRTLARALGWKETEEVALNT